MSPPAWLAITGGVGLLAGVVLRWRGSCLLFLLVIALVVAVYAYDVIDGGINEGLGGDPIPLAVILVFVLGPFFLSAGLGAVVGAWLRDRRA